MDGLPKRKSNRLPQFDYGTVGAYFITICSRDKAKVFGRVVGGGVLDAPRRGQDFSLRMNRERDAAVSRGSRFSRA